MNVQSHIVASIALTLIACIVHFTIRGDTNTKALDTVRYYTMKRVSGDVTGARALVESEDKWLSVACQAAQNKTLVSDACVVERKTLRDGILSKMNCMSYNSQVCTFLRNLTSGLLVTRSYGGTTYYVGRSLLGTVPNQGTLTYRQILYNTLNNVQNMFRNAYKAQQADDFYMSRTILYNFIVFVVLANVLVHYFDQWPMTWTNRFLLRTLLYIGITLLPTIIFLAGYGGAALTTLLWIWTPAVVIFVYYEAFMDATIERPWIHPYVFSLVYTSVSLLALLESGVNNYFIVLMTIGQAHAVTFLYTQIVWYWAGYNEKITHAAKQHMTKRGAHYAPEPTAEEVLMHGTHAANLYLTKEMQYALLLGVIAITIPASLQVIAPFDYECGDLTIRASPIVFLAIAVFGTLYVQSMQLGDHYGKDKEKEAPGDKYPSAKDKLVFKSTRMTGGKLAVSLLLLAFATLFEFNLVGQYFRWTRAYNDRLPERAWQYDLTNKYTIGTGFLPSPTLYL